MTFLKQKFHSRAFTPTPERGQTHLGEQIDKLSPRLVWGFTLVEILLVLGIISLLASLILIVTTKAREKARIAKSLNFSAQIHHALGAYLLAEYEFEETGYGTCPGGKDFCDNSGNGNHGTMVSYGGTISRQPNNEIPQLGQTGYFPGLAYIHVNPSNNLVTSGFITIEAWIKPEEFGEDPVNDQRWIVGKGDYFWYFYLQMAKLCFAAQGTFCSSENVFEEGKWYHVVATRGQSKVKLFVNAKEVLSQLNSGAFPDEPRPILIGYGIMGPGFIGYIDQIRIYSEPLSPAQIKKLYVEGVKERGLLTKE